MQTLNKMPPIRAGLNAYARKIDELANKSRLDGPSEQTGAEVSPPTQEKAAPDSEPRLGGERPEARDGEAESRPRNFLISSLFLRKCYSYLMRGVEEAVTYLSGVEVGETAVIDQLVPFRMDVQEITSARGDIVSSTEVLILLSDRGYALQGIAHCHPGSGASATHPSSIDMEHHRRLEEGEYRALGLIMTRDGHCRFHTYRMPFSVTVVGNDIVKFDDNSYRLILNFNPNAETKKDENPT